MKTPKNTKKVRKVKKIPMIIFATSDADLVDQLPSNSEDIELIKEISKHTYKVTLK